MQIPPISLTLAILFTFALKVLSQSSVRALKFDEFSNSPTSSSNQLVERGNRLAQWLQKAPRDMSVVIIYYDPRKRTYPTKYGIDWAEYTKGILMNGYRIAPERIVIQDGGLREFTTLEYWIVSPTSAPPPATPTFDESEVVYCPDIDVASDGFNYDQGRPLRFSASVKGSEPAAKLNFRWNVSSGRITDGQGTDPIQVDLSSSRAKRVTASVQIEGLSPECNPYRSAHTELGRRPFKFAEIHYNYSYFIALLDSMFSTLLTDPSLRGHVIMYGYRSGSRSELNVRLDAARKYILFRKFDASRVTITPGGYREEPSVELYLLPPGVAPPAPTPSLDERFVGPVRNGRAKPNKFR